MLPKVGDKVRGIVGKQDDRYVYEESIVKEVVKVKRRYGLRPMYRITLVSGKHYFHMD